eukprot:TRINITY_DN5211_c0_g1_i1.p1 TRINITY_DN5211_c0_g1~~TRINITY_DN5211_c0_g1_i1.p1  ORF type:complete len:943 (+),score=367.38 TRINITY_DN5211_c0_g1_i1:265-2829(+)
MLISGADALKKLSPELLLAAKRVLERPNDVQAKEHLERKTQDINLVFDKIATAAKIVPSLTRRLQSVLDHIRNLIRLAEELKKVSGTLTTAITSGAAKATQDELRRRVEELAAAIIKEVELAAQNSGDQSEYRRQQINNTIKSLKEAQARFFKALESLERNANSQPAKNEAKEAEDFLSDTINKLIVLSDPNGSPEARLMYTLQDVLAVADELSKKIPSGTKEEILAVVKKLDDAALQFYKDADAVLEATTDPVAKKALGDSIEKIKGEITQLATAARLCAENRNDEKAKQHFQAIAQNLASSTKQFMEQLKEARRSADGSTMTATQKKLLSAATVAKQTAHDTLHKVKTDPNNTPELVANAKKVAENILTLTKAAEDALIELPANDKAEGTNQIQALKKNGAELLTSLKSILTTGAANPAAQQSTAVAVNNFVTSVDTLVDTFIKHDPEGASRQIGEDAKSHGKKMEAAAKDGSAAGLVAAARALGESVILLEKELNRAMAEPDTLPSKRQEGITAMANLKTASAAFVNACKAAIADPKNASLMNAVVEARKSFDAHVDKVLDVIATRKGTPQAPATIPAKVDNNRSVAEDNQLVIFAKEQFSIAMQMVEEAEKIAAKETNPARKQKIQTAIAGVKTSGQEVIKAAESVVEDPMNPEKLSKLDSSQAKLCSAIEQLAEATRDTSSSSTELVSAMKEMNINDKDAGEDLLALALETIALIVAFLDNANNSKRDPKKVIDEAREIAAKSNQLSALLKAKAMSTTDPVYKEQLMNFSKILRDKAMQVKILSAVQVASQKSDDSQQVASCTKGLSATIKDALATLQEQSLKDRVKSAMGRVNAIRKVVNVWRRTVRL